ncbi:MAG: RAMP superfamily CRISPR-associated protein [Cyanobacteria bacterium P01_F01_bin.33]
MVQLRDLLQTSQTSISLTASIDSALCVGAGGSTGSLADKPIVRLSNGRLLIPGSQLKGRLRHECEKLVRGLGWPVCESPDPQSMCPQRAGLSNAADFSENDRYRVHGDRRHCLICQIFGNPSLPSRILVDDLVCQEDPDNLPEVLRPGVTINRRRGTAEDQKLYFLETTPVNIQLKFEGVIYFEHNCPEYAKALILAGLHHIHALGGSKSAGIGWLTWSIDEQEIADDVWDLLVRETAK